jgi:TrmH family RNA methyltransferase
MGLPEHDPMEPIRSRTNPHLKRVRKLQEKGGEGLVVIEGVRMLEEAAGVREAFVSPRAGERHSSLLARLKAHGVAVHLVEERLLGSLSELSTSEGILAVASRPSFDPARIFAPPALVPVLCGIQNPGNVGALFRTGEAAGASGVLVGSGTADPLSAKALRGSMGSALRLPHERFDRPEEAVALCHRRGLRVVATEAEGGTPYDRVDWKEGAAVLLGSEGAGLPPEVVAQADAVVSIPLGGGVESLNVAAAAAVILFEAARQRRNGAG